MANRFLSFALIVLLLVTNSASVLQVRAANTSAVLLSVYPITVAGVPVEIDLPFEVPAFIQPAPDDALQTASSTRWKPFFEVSLEAVTSMADGAPATLEGIKKNIKNVRSGQTPRSRDTHRILFLGQEVDSTSNRVEIHLIPTVKQPVIIHEWVTQSNGLYWILRVSFTPNQVFDEALLGQIVVREAQPGALSAQPELGHAAAPGLQAARTVQAVGDLPAPAWWDGECDTNFYASKSGGRAAYPLEGVFRGVKACGPRPVYDYAPNVVAHFYPGAWGVLEWQCVELTLRYLYLAYEVPPYSGHGKDMVANYRGTRLVKIANGVVGKAPQPGDVLSYGPTTTYGHTSVVSASNVDSSGNGTVTVIEQNSSAAGTRILNVKNWYVQASIAVSGWLHEAKPGGPTNLSSSPEQTQVALTWTAAADTTIDGYRIYRNGVGIATVGHSTTRYVDAAPLCLTNNYFVTAYRGAIESNPTATTSVQVNVPCKVYLPSARSKP